MMAFSLSPALVWALGLLGNPVAGMMCGHCPVPDALARTEQEEISFAIYPKDVNITEFPPDIESVSSGDKSSEGSVVERAINARDNHTGSPRGERALWEDISPSSRELMGFWESGKSHLSPLSEIISGSGPEIFDSYCNPRGASYYNIIYSSAFDHNVSTQLPLRGSLSEIDAGPSGIGSFFGGIGSAFGISQALAHEAELPEKQASLPQTDDDKPKSKQAGGVTREPVPAGAFLYLLIAGALAFVCGIVIGRIATGPLPRQKRVK
jgi:hypothetical protein